MKKWTNYSLLAILLTGLVLFNCKKKETDPLEPDNELVNEIGNLDLPTLNIQQPAAVEVTESSITASPAVAAMATGLASLAAGGPVPESLTAAGADVAAALSTEEVAALSSVNSSTIDAVTAGGELPAELKAIMDKVAADEKLKAYLPTFSLPTVNGQPVSARTGDKIGDESFRFDDIAVADECLQKANQAFDEAKAKLDATRATQLAAVTAAYNTAIAPLAAEQTACTGGLDAKYAALAAEAVASSAAANAALEAARETLGDQLYETLKALNTIALLGHLSSLNTLKAADAQACIAVNAAKTTAAQAARDANTASVEAAYQTALATATELRGRLLQSCHNQGGGN